MPCTKKRLNNESGFTIIEIVMVTVILAIGAAVTVWGVGLYLPEMQLKQAIRNLRSDMQLTRMRAIREDTTITLLFNTGNNTYTIFYDNGAGAGTADDWIHHPDEPEIKQISLPRHVTLTDVDFPVNTDTPQVRFDRLGNPNVAGIVEMSNTRNNTRTLICNMVAQIQIQ